MNETTDQNIIIRTSRGLTIAGTRITLYSIMDYIKANWPPKLIKDLFDLTDQQIAAVLAYIEANRDEADHDIEGHAHSLIGVLGGERSYPRT